MKGKRGVHKKNRDREEVLGMYKIMETPDNIGIKLFVLAALKAHYFEYLSLFFLLFTLYSASGNALKTVCSMNVLQNGRFDRFSKWTDCWCAFSWSICNKNSRLIWCIQSSSVQGYDGTHKSLEDIIG